MEKKEKTDLLQFLDVIKIIVYDNKCLLMKIVKSFQGFSLFLYLPEDIYRVPIFVSV